jgi:hypothetical protein
MIATFLRICLHSFTLAPQLEGRRFEQGNSRQIEDFLGCKTKTSEIKLVKYEISIDKPFFNRDDLVDAMCDYPNPPHPKSLSQSGRGTLRNLSPLLLSWEKGLGDEG